MPGLGSHDVICHTLHQQSAAVGSDISSRLDSFKLGIFLHSAYAEPSFFALLHFSCARVCFASNTCLPLRALSAFTICIHSNLLEFGHPAKFALFPQSLSPQALLSACGLFLTGSGQSSVRWYGWQC
jgi:hypothetical protein